MYESHLLNRKSLFQGHADSLPQGSNPTVNKCQAKIIMLAQKTHLALTKLNRQFQPTLDTMSV